MTDTRNAAALVAAAKGDIANALIASTPGGIEAQEARGQAEMASSFRTLPKDMSRETGESFGFVYGEEADDIFINVIPPAGWRIEPTKHHMHSDIIDAQGRKRGAIFYKAAFYDRRASGNWMPRYQVVPDWSPSDGVTSVPVFDNATGEVLERYDVPASDLPSWQKSESAEKAAAAFLDERFPDHRNQAAYW